MEVEKAFGIVPLRKTREGNWQVLILYHRHLFWGLPKGHLMDKETPFAAAKRELKEETNLDVVSYLGKSFEEEYDYGRQGKIIHKKVTYFACLVEGKIQLQPEEILKSQWFFLDEAQKILTYPESKKLLTEVAKILESS